MQPLNTLVRRASIGDTAVGDVRFVVTADGRGCIIAKHPSGGFFAAVSATDVTWRVEADGRVTVDTFAGEQWTGIRDTRCGSCGGRYELRTVDAEQFLPQVGERPDDSEPGEIIAGSAP